jgi:RNA polymerase sigma factor (sigma-70 family)
MAATRSLSASVQHLGEILLADATDLPDAELVGRFVERRDETAFAALVRRYGGVVFGVCRRVLRHTQDAEDAFQATFLVFARKAVSVRRGGTIGNWLYGVAYNTARKAKAMRHRREVKEREAAERRSAPPATAPDDLQEVLDGELHALPDKYRTPIVLCDLMGLTAREAAVEVGCPQKTLGTRLTRGRSMLARRLSRRGVAISAGVLAAALAPDATAAIPPPLIGSTIRAATGFPGGPPTDVSPAVLALTKGVSKVMLLKSLKHGVVLACGIAAAGLTIGPAIVAAHATPERSTRSDAVGAPAAPLPAKPLDPLHKLVRIVHNLLGLDETWDNKVFAAAPADDKEKPALAGTWERKEGELKLTFSDKEEVKISPHGKDDLILILGTYTVDKEGLVKVKVTGFEGKDEAKEKVKALLPVGSAFSFTWKVKGDDAALDDVKGDQADHLKTHLEGAYTQKK